MTERESLHNLLREQFAIEWMSVGDCSITLCTGPGCCLGIEKLWPFFGIRESLTDDHSRNRIKMYEATEELLDLLGEETTSEWRVAFEIFNYMRYAKSWLKDDPFRGLREIPKPLARVQDRCDWTEVFGRISEERLQSGDSERVRLDFVRSIVEELFPDRILLQLVDSSRGAALLASLGVLPSTGEIANAQVAPNDSIRDGDPWTLMPRRHHFEFDAPGDVTPEVVLAVNVPGPRVNAKLGRGGSWGWISVSGVRVVGNEDGHVPDTDVNLLIEHHGHAVQLAEALIDSALRADHGQFRGSADWCRKVGMITTRLREKLLDPDLNEGTSISRFDPYDQIGYSDFLDEAVIDGARPKWMSLTPGRRMVVVEDLAEALMLLAKHCYLTDYRKRVQSLLFDAIYADPNCGGIAWSVICGVLEAMGSSDLLLDLGTESQTFEDEAGLEQAVRETKHWIEENLRRGRWQ
jgi:hypothetical protein